MREKVLRFAAFKHHGQKRDGGMPYIIHPIRVSQLVDGELEKVCALLHDVLEDTDTTEIDLAEKFGVEVAKIVCILTHKKGESYVDYIRRIKNNPVAVTVKLADIADNLADNPSEHAKEKYAKAIEILTS